MCLHEWVGDEPLDVLGRAARLLKLGQFCLGGLLTFLPLGQLPANSHSSQPKNAHAALGPAFSGDVVGASASLKRRDIQT